MSNKLYTLIAALLLTATSFAQAPEKMSYQVIVRDSDDNLLSDQEVGLQMRILTASGVAVYIETQITTTNLNGLVTLELGAGTVVSGDFAAIDWGVDKYYIKTEIDIDNNASYDITGTSQLLSVPYALHAKTTENTFSGDYNDLSNQPTSLTYTVNTFYAELGGYVIEISASGKHGLVVAMQDQGSSNWYNLNDLLSNSANHDANGAEFKDWRVPTKRELNLLYLIKTSGNGANLGGGYYWNSTELNYEKAYAQHFWDGTQESFTKNTEGAFVRAVRSF